MISRFWLARRRPSPLFRPVAGLRSPPAARAYRPWPSPVRPSVHVKRRAWPHVFTMRLLYVDAQECTSFHGPTSLAAKVNHPSLTQPSRPLTHHFEHCVDSLLEECDHSAHSLPISGVTWTTVGTDNALATPKVSRVLSSWQLLSFYSRRHAVWCYRLCWILVGQYIVTSVCFYSFHISVGWLRDTAVERRSLAGHL